MLRLATAAAGLLLAAAPLVAPSPTLIHSDARVWTEPTGAWYPEGPIKRETALRTRTVEDAWATEREHAESVLCVVRGRIVPEP